MMTLRLFSNTPESIPTTTSWYLAELGEAKGRQELFTKQSPQKLKVLREHAIIESAVSSNRIEGIEIDQKRVGTIIFGKPLLRDRNEEEVAGYRSVLKLIHEQSSKLKVSEETIMKFHELSRGEIWDAGKYKERDGDIIEKYANGRERVRFKTVPAAKTPAAMGELVGLWRDCLREKWVPPLVGLAAFNLDYLCVHPFRDGNGRVSRLLLLLQTYHLGYEVGRYVSLERLIEEHKDRYYETLELSSQRWHEGKHDPWPFVNYVLFILKTAYKEFERRVGEIKSPRGTKTELVESSIGAFSGEFTLVELERACPGVSRDMIRRVLFDLSKVGKVTCTGRGPAAKWTGKGNTSKRV